MEVLSKDLLRVIHDLFTVVNDQNCVQASAFLLACLVSGHVQGQHLAMETGCLDDMLSILRDLVQEGGKDENQWMIMTRAVGVCISNPQNENNQRLTCSILPHILKVVSAWPYGHIVRHALSLMDLVMVNNASNQSRFRSCGGLDSLSTLISTALPKAADDICFLVLISAITTLNFAVAENEPSVRHARSLGVVPHLISLLQSPSLILEDARIPLMALAHLLEYSGGVEDAGVRAQCQQLMVGYLADTDSSQDDELLQQIKYILTLCKDKGCPDGSAVESASKKTRSNEGKNDENRVPSKSHAFSGFKRVGDMCMQQCVSPQVGARDGCNLKPWQEMAGDKNIFIGKSWRHQRDESPVQSHSCGSVHSESTGCQQGRPTRKCPAGFSGKATDVNTLLTIMAMQEKQNKILAEFETINSMISSLTSDALPEQQESASPSMSVTLIDGGRDWHPVPRWTNPSVMELTCSSKPSCSFAQGGDLPIEVPDNCVVNAPNTNSTRRCDSKYSENSGFSSRNGHIIQEALNGIKQANQPTLVSTGSNCCVHCRRSRSLQPALISNLNNDNDEVSAGADERNQPPGMGDSGAQTVSASQHDGSVISQETSHGALASGPLTGGRTRQTACWSPSPAKNVVCVSSSSTKRGEAPAKQCLNSSHCQIESKSRLGKGDHDCLGRYSDLRERISLNRSVHRGLGNGSNLEVVEVSTDGSMQGMNCGEDNDCSTVHTSDNVTGSSTSTVKYNNVSLCREDCLLTQGKDLTESKISTKYMKGNVFTRGKSSGKSTKTHHDKESEREKNQNSRDQVNFPLEQSSVVSNQKLFAELVTDLSLPKKPCNSQKPSHGKTGSQIQTQVQTFFEKQSLMNVRKVKSIPTIQLSTQAHVLEKSYKSSPNITQPVPSIKLDLNESFEKNLKALSLARPKESSSRKGKGGVRVNPINGGSGQVPVSEDKDSGFGGGHDPDTSAEMPETKYNRNKETVVEEHVKLVEEKDSKERAHENQGKASGRSLCETKNRKSNERKKTKPCDTPSFNCGYLTPQPRTRQLAKALGKRAQSATIGNPRGLTFRSSTPCPKRACSLDERRMQNSRPQTHISNEQRRSSNVNEEETFIFSSTSSEMNDYSSSDTDISKASLQRTLKKRKKRSEHLQPKRRIRVPYSDQEVLNLRHGVSTLGTQWQQILSIYQFHPSRTSVDLKEKFKRLMNPSKSTKKRRNASLPFSRNEIRRLKRGVKMFGHNWKAILAGKRFLPGRTAQDLRNKWRVLCKEFSDSCF